MARTDAQVDRDAGVNRQSKPTVDASDAAEKARIKAMSQANAASRPATMLEQAQTLLASSKSRLAELEAQQAANYVAQGLNPDGSKKTNTQLLQEKQAKEQADRTALAASNPLFNKATKPTDAPAGMYYQWIGGTNTGQWQLYKIPTSTKVTKTTDSSSDNKDDNSNSSKNDNNGAATKYAADLAAASEAAAIKSERMSAWAVLKAEFDKYGLGSLADVVKDMIINGTPSAQATMILRERPEYKARFAGNEARRTAGLNVYDEGTYLDLENAMAEIFTAYGQKSLMGSTREQQQATFAKYIGATIAPTELKRRMDIATGLSKSDNNTLKAIKQLYPMIGDNDIVAYFLNPQETLPKLETKAQAASIGGAFLQQGLKINSASMEEYAALGISREQAQLGAAQIASVLPRAATLRSYEEGMYTQEQAEDVYLRQSATAKKELEDISKREIARLSGSAGTSKVSLKSAARNTF
jgi:hypothetical protein